ncbi:MAG: tripartite tricarboxylate transporter substrate binding protein [Candidatus Zixiibacteriota bacterium]
MFTRQTGMVVFVIFVTFFYGPYISGAAEVNYPTKPIEILISYSPGGGTDLGSRVIAEHSKKYLGQDLIVINKPGGAGRVGTTLIAKAKPDGYTIGAIADGSVVFSSQLAKVSYNPLEDFTYICQFGIMNIGLVVPAESPFRTIKDFIEFARVNPNKLTVSTLGVNGIPQTTVEALSHIEGVKIKPVPYSGAALAVTAMLGGHVMATAGASSGWASHLRAKKVRLLALFGDERVALYPDVPTLKELGYPIVLDSWYVMLGPRNMEKAIVNKLGEAFKKAIDSPAFIKMAKKLEVWVEKPLFYDELKERLFQRYHNNAALFKQLGIGIKK